MRGDAAAWPTAARVRFGLVVSCLVAAVLLTPHQPILRDVLAPLEAFTTDVTARLVAATALEVRHDGTVLSHPSGFAYRVYWRCTGLVPALFLGGLVLASPGRRREKWVGVAVGSVLIFVVNQARLVHLFHVGVHNRPSFDLVHSVIWEGAIVAVVLGTWFGWLRWSASRTKDRSC